MGLTSYEETVANLKEAYAILCGGAENNVGLSACSALRCQCAVKDALNHIEANEALPVCVYQDRINKCACGNEVIRYWHPYYCGFCGRELIWR